MNPVTPKPRRFTYGGISSLVSADGSQKLLLVGDQERAGPRADVRIKSPGAFREAMSTLLLLISRGYSYYPSTPEIGASVGESYDKWKQAAPNLTPVEARQAFLKFLADSDPDAWQVMDPVVTLTEDAITVEVFDRRARIYGALTLNRDMFEGEITPGTLHIEGGQDVLEDLSLIDSRYELRLRIGAEVADDLDEQHRGEIVRQECFPSSWQRQLVQMLAASTLPGRRVPMARVDLFNILRYLRLHREDSGDPSAMRFALVPGEVPEITIEPWEWRYPCTGATYAGNQSEIIGLWDRREPMDLQRILPYVQSAQVQLLGEAQPTFWTLDCGSFSFTLATPGFRPLNWSRGLMMDIHLPRHTDNPVGYDDVLAALRSAGSATAGQLIERTGLSAEAIEAAVRRGCQNGLVLKDPLSQRIFARELFAGGVDVEELKFRSGQEGKAWRLVSAGRVDKRLTQRPTGEIDFVEAPSAASPEGVPSVVTEPKHPFQEKEPEFTPKLEVNRAGATRKPGCTCTFWKRQTASTKDPCAHLQALWLQHSLDVQEEKRLEKTDPGRIKVRNSTFVKRRKDDEEVHEITLMFRRVTESWGTRLQLRDAHGRRQVQIFHSVADAREAFFARCAELELKGFLNASS
jgi:hypothetical protein